MRRAPLLSCLLWSSVGAGTVTGCGDGGPTFIDAAVDAVEIDAIGPIAMVPPSASMTSVCGQALPATVDLTVSNGGDQPLVVSAASATGGFTVTTSLPVTVPAGGSMPLTIRPPAAVIGTDLGGSQRTGTLTLTTNQGGAPPTVALSTDILGANLELLDGLGNPLTALSLSSSAGCPGPATVSVRNTGTSTVTVASGSATYFAFSGWSPGSTVAPGSGVVSTQIRAWSLADNGCSHTEVLDFTATGTVCTANPIQLTAVYTVAGQSACFCS